ncbi:hypothetical protein FKM82_028790 [Ascaphus truei]
MIKIFLIPIFVYLSFVFPPPAEITVTLYSLFFQLLWGNRLNVLKRDITYLQREKGGLGMVNTVYYFLLSFLYVLICRIFSTEMTSFGIYLLGSGCLPLKTD